MRQYQDYAKQSKSAQYKKLLFGALILILVLVPLIFSHAETVEEVRNKIAEKNAEIQKLESQIKAFQGELDNLGKQKNSLGVSIKQLDVTKKKLMNDIAITQKKIDRTNLTIQDLSKDIGNKENSISTNVGSIAAGLRLTNELEGTSIIEAILSKDDFTVIWNEIDNIMSVRESIRDNISELKEIKGELEVTRNTTIEAKNQLTELKTDLGDQQKVVVQNTNEKTKLLTQTKNSEANYQKLVQEQLARKLALEKEIRDYESRLKFILDPSSLPGPGVLSWPLTDIYVTQEFGAKTGPHRTYANGHSGTDFRARTPVPVFAMADGVVAGTGDTDVSCPGASFGRWILIKYDNGLASTFGHLSLIKVVKGQKVSRGDTVGYSGATGRVTGPHLHVSLYAAGAVNADSLPSVACPGKILTQPLAAINAYLDPMYYLPPLP